MAWLFLASWVLIAVVVMVYFVHRTIDAIEHPPSPIPPMPPLVASPLPDASDVTEIKVIPTVFPVEYNTLLAVNAWASPRATVADCSLSLWMIHAADVLDQPTFYIPATEFASFLALFKGTPKGTSLLLCHKSSWGYHLQITTKGGELIKLPLYIDDCRSDGKGVVAYFEAGPESPYCYVRENDLLKQKIVKAMWAKK